MGRHRDMQSEVPFCALLANAVSSPYIPYYDLYLPGIVSENVMCACASVTGATPTLPVMLQQFSILPCLRHQSTRRSDMDGFGHTNFRNDPFPMHALYYNSMLLNALN